jgi:drug/metabolite transporter (DMT)-like permease
MSDRDGPRPRRHSLIEIHLAVFLFGFPGLFGKWLALSPPLIVFGRVVFASLTLALVLKLSGRPMALGPARDMRLLVLCGFVLALHWTLFFKSVQVSSVAVGLLAYSMFPVFTSLLEPLVFKERWDPASLAFSALCVVGVFLIVPAFNPAEPVFQGVVWGMAAGLTFAVLTLLNRGLVQRQASLAVAFYQDLFAAVFLLPFVLASRFAVSAGTLGKLILLGVFGTAAAHALFIDGMRTIRARTASIISSLEPVYGIVLALLLLKEVPSPRTVAGGLVILAATLMVTARPGRRS